jgi:nucleotide-binding universal stress UspA family protein
MFKSVLLPIDLSQESSWKEAIPVATKMAKDSGAKLHVLTVIPDYGMAVVGSFFPADYAKNALAETEKLLTEFLSKHFEADVSVEGHVKHGTIYKEIIQSADSLNCELIVLASHRPETKDYLLGPNAARVARHAKQSVFVVRN